MTSEYFHFLSIIGVAFFAISGTLLGHEKVSVVLVWWWLPR